jgi:hypothetical protein
MKSGIASKSITAMLVFAVTQICLAGGLTMSGSPKRSAPQQQPTGILSTSGNQPVSVNGTNVISGATIVGGTVIQTPDKVMATITIPGHGTLEILPKTQLSIEIDLAGNIRVTLVAGCANLRTSKGTTGEIENAQGVVGRTDGSADGVVNGCRSVPPTGGGNGGYGVHPSVPILIGGFEAVGAGFALAHRGRNPSAAGL